MTTTALEYQSPKPGQASLFTVFLVVFIDMIGFGIVLTNLQLYGHDFGINNYFVLTVLGATYSICQFFCAPLLGKWSDKVGRRPVLIISQTGTLLGFLLLYAAHFFEVGNTTHFAWLGVTLLFASRVLDGISGGNISTAFAYVADITTPENRSKGMGAIGAAFGIGFVFGPPIGGITAYYFGLQYVPLVAAVFSLTALVLSIKVLPESLNRSHKPADARRYSASILRRALGRPVIGALILMVFVNGFAFAGMEQTLSLVIQNRLYPAAPVVTPATAAGVAVVSVTTEPALTGADVGTMEAEGQRDMQQGIRKQDARASRASGFLFLGVGIIAVAIQGGMIHRLTKKFGEARLVMAGPALIAVGLFIIGIKFETHAEMWAGLATGCFILSIGSSFFSPSIQALISRHAAAHEQGEILGANQGMGSLARALGPLLAGLLFQWVAPGMPYFVGAAITVGVAVAAAVMRKKLMPPGAAAPQEGAGL